MSAPGTASGPAAEVMRLGARELIHRLEAARAVTPAAEFVLAFDADGTLWNLDVGEMLFEAALSQAALREEARAALAECAAMHQLDAAGSSNELAARLFAAFRDGRMAERECAAMQAWCYAGFTRVQWWQLARESLDSRLIAARHHAPTVEVLRWAQARGIRCIIVSASPQPAVEAGAATVGIAPCDVFATCPGLIGERLTARLERFPWAAGKAEAARAATGRDQWLAAFGDSAFDVELLRHAFFPVAVRARPGLRARYGEFDGTIFELADSG